MVILFLSLILLASTVWVLLPLRQQPGEAPAQAGERDELEARHRHLLLALQDLDFEMQTGKLSGEDHQAMRRRVQGEAVEVLRRLDELEAPAAGPEPVREPEP
jgi:hypothetical protein